MDAAERWTSAVVLGDGTSALIRPIRPDDADALAAFHVRQSAESRYLRYFSPKLQLTNCKDSECTEPSLTPTGDRFLYLKQRDVP